jgi:hypothetical protein
MKKSLQGMKMSEKHFKSMGKNLEYENKFESMKKYLLGMNKS